MPHFGLHGRYELRAIAELGPRWKALHDDGAHHGQPAEEREDARNIKRVAILEANSLLFDALYTYKTLEGGPAKVFEPCFKTLRLSGASLILLAPRMCFKLLICHRFSEQETQQTCYASTTILGTILGAIEP